jgi:hypothetical protein
MATKLLSAAECNFSDAACETLARLAVDIIGNDDFLSDAQQNSFVIDLVSAVGSKIAFNAIARQLWRINQYTPYSDTAYAYGPSYANCPSSFLITHAVAASSTLQLSNEQQRTLAAFINARVSIGDLLVVCPYHVLMAFCKWLNAGNSSKVMTLDGSIAYNTRNLVAYGAYAYDNAYGSDDYLQNAIFHYQLTSLLQTSTGAVFDAAYSAKSIMSGFVLDTMYSAATTAEDKYRLVASLILGVNSQNPLRAGYSGVANVSQITSSYDGTTFSVASSESATHLSPTLLNAFSQLTDIPRVYFNNGLAIVGGKSLTSNNLKFVTATNLSAQDYFDAYALNGVASDIVTLKTAGYNVKAISGIKMAGAVVPAFQSVKNFRAAEFSYSDIISTATGLSLSSPQQYYDKVASELTTLTTLAKMNLLIGAPFNLTATQLYSIATDASVTSKVFNNAPLYIDASFSYATVNNVFDASNASAFYTTYKLSEKSSSDAIRSLKINGQYNISAIKTVSGLVATIPNYKTAGFTFTDIKTGFDASLNTAQAFYNTFNGDNTFNAGAEAYNVFQQVFILKSLNYDASGVNSVTRVSNGIVEKAYPSLLSYIYTVRGTTGTGDNVVILDSRLKENVPAVAGDKSFTLDSLKTPFNITDAQSVFNAMGLTGSSNNARADVRKIKYILSTVAVYDIKSIKKNGVVIPAFQPPAAYSGEESVSINGNESITIKGFTNTEITTGFSSDYKSLLSMSSATSLPSFSYVDATYLSNGSNLLTNLINIAGEKNSQGDAYVHTSFRTLLLASINETRSGTTESPTLTDTTLTGNNLKYAVYRLVYISVVAKSVATSGEYAPSTDKGMYSYFDLSAFKDYLATGTKYSDFLKPSEYVYFSSATTMGVPTTTTTTVDGVSTTTSTYRIASQSQGAILTGRSYNKNKVTGVAFTEYSGNSVTVRYALGKIASGAKLIDNVSTTDNLYYDSGLTIPDAIAAISSTNKVSVITANAWPVETHVLLKLSDVVAYVQSSFFEKTKTLAQNIDAAFALPYSATAWNFANIMSGPVTSAAAKMNLDGLSWKQMIAAGADADAIVADLAANINAIAISGSLPGNDFVSQYGVPYAQALVIANNIKSVTTGGRTANNGLWSLTALAGNPYYSRSQKKALFNNDATLASQILADDDFIKLKWTVAELKPLLSRLEIADLLTATEQVSNEFDSNYTSTTNSSFIRMIYDTTTDRIALVKAKYASLSDSSANAIAILTNKSDIIDAVSGITV